MVTEEDIIAARRRSAAHWGIVMTAVCGLSTTQPNDGGSLMYGTMRAGCNTRWSMRSR